MIVELGILPQSTMKRTRRSRATLLESAVKLPIRGTSLCRISHFHALSLTETYACTALQSPPLQGEGWMGMVLRLPPTCAKGLAVEGAPEKSDIACSLEIPPPNHHTCAITFFSARFP